VCFGENAFPHLRVEKRYFCAVEEATEHFGDAFSGGAGTDENERTTSGVKHLEREIDGFFVRVWTTNFCDFEWSGIGWLGGDVFGKFEVDGAGAFGFGEAEGFADEGGDFFAGSNLFCEFCDRAHHSHNIDDLKSGLF